MLYHVKKVHINEKYFQCDKCDKRFFEKYKFNRHVKELHNPWLKELMTKCEVCNKTIKKNILSLYLKNHIKRHKRCNKCYSSFTTVDELNKHKDDCKIILQCKYCMKQFGYPDNLNHHIKKFQEGTRLKSFKCDDCSKTFNLQSNLQRHNVTVHQKIKSHKCDTCERHFGTKQELKRHNASVHDDLQKLICHMCDKKFSIKGNLDRHHKRVHAGAARAPEVRGGQKPNFAPLFRKFEFYCIFM